MENFDAKGAPGYCQVNRVSTRSNDDLYYLCIYTWERFFLIHSVTVSSHSRRLLCGQCDCGKSSKNVFVLTMERRHE